MYQHVLLRVFFCFLLTGSSLVACKLSKPNSKLSSAESAFAPAEVPAGPVSKSSYMPAVCQQSQLSFSGEDCRSIKALADLSPMDTALSKFMDKQPSKDVKSPDVFVYVLKPSQERLPAYLRPYADCMSAMGNEAVAKAKACEARSGDPMAQAYQASVSGSYLPRYDQLKELPNNTCEVDLGRVKNPFSGPMDVWVTCIKVCIDGAIFTPPSSPEASEGLCHCAPGTTLRSGADGKSLRCDAAP